MAVNSAANLLSVDSLFTTQKERDEAQRETVMDIPLAEISDFPNHPFKVRMDESMTEMADSVAVWCSCSWPTLTIFSPTAPTGKVTISASKENSKRMWLVVWDDGAFGPNGGQQDTVTYTQSVTDPIATYIPTGTMAYGKGCIELCEQIRDQSQKMDKLAERLSSLFM